MRDQGTFTFLFTDMEESTPMVRRLAERWPGVLAAHRRLIATAVTEAGGDLAGSEGEGHLAVFSTADRALAAALSGQQALDAHDWPPDADVRVRMGLHAGVAEHREGDWVGLSLHIAARVCDAANGGQVLLSAEAASLVERSLPSDARLEDRGAYYLKGLGDPVHLIELRHPALRGEGRPLRAGGTTPAALPTPLTSFVGREVELAELVDLVGRHRIVTVTGAGGAGKTRLALEAARALQAVRPWFVELAPLRDPNLVTNAIAGALGLWQDPSRPLIDAVAERVGAGEALLVLDNCEHLLGACRQVTTALVQRCPGLQVLATSREPLGLPGEVVWRAPSLDVPAGSGSELEASGAGRLFLDRARSADAHLVLSGADRDAVVEICARLDGIPLALELAAARVRVLRPTQIADRLDDVPGHLTAGAGNVATAPVEARP